MVDSWVRVLGIESGVPESRGYTVPWNRVEAELGFSLPCDYKEFVNWFGPGTFDGELFYVAVPGVANPGMELVSLVRMNREIHKENLECERIANKWPYPGPSKEGALVCWGKSINGDAFHWRTSGSPEGWSVVVEHNGSFSFHEHPGSMSDFLLRFLRGEVIVDFIPEFENGPPVPFYPEDGTFDYPGMEPYALERYGCFRTDSAG